MPDDARDARVSIALGALDGVVRCGEDMLGESVNRAPVDEGTLRGSASLVLIVNGARFEGSGAKAAAAAVVAALARAGRPVSIDAEVSFNTVYAARQHEELDWQHPKGGRAKYLESVLLERGSRYGRIIQAAASAGA